MKVGKWYSVGLNQLTDYHRLTLAEDLPPWMLLGELSPHALQAETFKLSPAPGLQSLALFCCALTSVQGAVMQPFVHLLQMQAEEEGTERVR